MQEATDKRGAPMTSRELIWRAARFEGPDRIPYQLPDEFGSDMLQVGIGPDPDFVPSIKTDLKWEDEWGCIWEKAVGDKTCGQVTGHPPVADVAVPPAYYGGEGGGDTLLRPGSTVVGD